MTSTTSRSQPSSRITSPYAAGLGKAVEVASHYGFNLVSPLSLERTDREHVERHDCPQEHVAVLRLAENHFSKNGPDVLLIAHLRKVPYKNKTELRLEIVGDAESSAEGLLFQVTNAILKEYGYTGLSVGINSVGGRETSSGFVQAMSSYLRNRLPELHPDCRTTIRTSLFAPLRCTHDACVAVRENAPQSINYLTEQSRRHFREVLEYLESLDLPYIVDPSLIGSEHYTTRTVFSMGVPIPPAADGSPAAGCSKPLVWGERYDHLSKKIGIKKAIPAVHVTIDLNIESDTAQRQPEKPSTSAQPHAYLIQVGLPAKMKALAIHESLRKARIKVSINLHKKSVTEQMDHATALGTPFIVIIGHKEVQDGAALIRHLPTNQQHIVPFPELPTHLKTLLVVKRRKA